MVPDTHKIFQKNSLKHLKGRLEEPAASGVGRGRWRALERCRRGLVSREGLPTPNPTEQILW